MIDVFFEKNNEINNETRFQKQKIQVVRFLSQSKQPHTIPEISKQVKISAPTALKLLSELIEDGFLIEEGKKETSSGRRPTLYNLNKELFYAIGVEINLKEIRISLLRIDFEPFAHWENRKFELTNNEFSLQLIIDSISNFINGLQIKKSQIWGIGIGITGRVNTLTGETFSFFDFLQQPFSKTIQESIGIPVVVENDSRALGLAELITGKAKGIKNSIFINASRGLGMCIVANGKIITGGLGFAGEFGHMQFGSLKRNCICGKQNCLGTEVSGSSLEEDLKLALARGEESVFIKNPEAGYLDILDAAIKGDSLCIKLLQKQGEKLGNALGNVLNLLNPDLLVIGGELAIAKDIFLDAVKIGLKRTALVNSLNSCKVESSKLVKNTVVTGAAALVFRNLELV